MSTSIRLLKTIRLVHLYFGVLITPALMFFAFTGAVQTFSLHETTRGSSYKPPAILVRLAQLHKKQTLVVPERKPPAPTPDRPRNPDAPRPGSGAASSAPSARPRDPDVAVAAPGDAAPSTRPGSSAAPRPPDGPPEPQKNLLPMKIFFLIVAIGLFTSTCTGLYMAYKYTRNTIAVSATLIAGIVIPILLTFV